MRTARVPVRLCYSYSPPVSVWATSNPTRTRSRARLVTRSNWSVPVNGGIVWMCRIGLFIRRAICSCMREVMLKLTMDYKMTKHMLNNCTLKESRTCLLVCTRHCYFIPFNHEHPVTQFGARLGSARLGTNLFGARLGLPWLGSGLGWQKVFIISTSQSQDNHGPPFLEPKYCSGTHSMEANESHF